MDNIIRSYWITWDNSDGTDGEEMFPATKAQAAQDLYNKLVSIGVPYIKMVACYNDHDVDLQSHLTSAGR